MFFLLRFLLCFFLFFQFFRITLARLLLGLCMSLVIESTRPPCSPRYNTRTEWRDASLFKCVARGKCNPVHRSQQYAISSHVSSYCLQRHCASCQNGYSGLTFRVFDPPSSYTPSSRNLFCSCISWIASHNYEARSNVHCTRTVIFGNSKSLLKKSIVTSFLRIIPKIAKFIGRKNSFQGPAYVIRGKYSNLSFLISLIWPERIELRE